MEPNLKQILELTEDNNKMLHHIRHSQKVASFVHTLYWIVILGITVASYYMAQPYIEQLQGFIKESGVTIDQIKHILPKK